MHFDLAPERIDEICRNTVARQRIPGLSIAVARDGEMIFSEGYGLRNVADGIKTDANTIYSIASVTKQFTAAAVLLLQERGLLSISDPLHKYFAWVPCSPDVTLMHLLSHTSGIPGYTEVPGFEHRCYSEAPFRDIVMLGADRTQAFAPGEQWQYSNTNYVILAGIIEATSQQSYAEFLSKWLFDPLELASTGVDDVWTIRNNYAVGHTSYSLGALERARDWHPCWEFGTGGLYSSAPDLARWNRALRSGKVVSDPSYMLMTQPRTLPDGTSTKYGFGLFHDEIDGVTEQRHTGGLPGFSTDNASYLDGHVDIVVISNRDAAGTYFSTTRKILSLGLKRESLASWYAPQVDADLASQADPVTWIETARSGRIGDLALTEEFTRFLQPRRRAALSDLAQYGNLLSCDILEASRRNPVNIMTYKVTFEQGILVALFITMMDSDEIDMMSFYPWDFRDADEPDESARALSIRAV